MGCSRITSKEDDYSNRVPTHTCSNERNKTPERERRAKTVQCLSSDQLLTIIIRLGWRRSGGGRSDGGSRRRSDGGSRSRSRDHFRGEMLVTRGLWITGEGRIGGVIVLIRSHRSLRLIVRPIRVGILTRLRVRSLVVTRVIRLVSSLTVGVSLRRMRSGGHLPRAVAAGR